MGCQGRLKLCSTLQSKNESATIFARSDAFKTALYFGVFISTFATQFPITHTLERLIKLAELPTRRR
jgi:hypothetical protein